MFLDVEFGEYRCSANPLGDNDETKCAIKDYQGSQGHQINLLLTA